MPYANDLTSRKRAARRPLLRRLLTGATVAAAAFTAALAPTSTPATASTTVPAANPLAAAPWGVYTGRADGTYPAWQSATGTTKKLLAKIALRPRVRWFGGWVSAAEIGAQVRNYITQTQNGDPDALVALATFRLWPGGEGNRMAPMSAAQQSDYKEWVRQVAAAIGSARTALILEPDLGMARNGWRPAVRFRLTAFAAATFSALPRTSVYIDASASDWLNVPEAVAMLEQAGIAHTRGFALNATHYALTADNLTFGANLSIALAAAGYPDKHFVLNTADNARGFTWKQYWAAHPQGNFNNAETCGSRTQPRCVTLGIPPTTDVANPAWHLPARVLPGARTWCDGYLWYGRPWLVNQAAPFDMSRALAVARTSPF